MVILYDAWPGCNDSRNLITGYMSSILEYVRIHGSTTHGDQGGPLGGGLSRGTLAKLARGTIVLVQLDPTVFGGVAAEELSAIDQGLELFLGLLGGEPPSRL